MLTQPASWILLVAAGCFLVFLLVKSRIPLVARDPASAHARKRIAEAKHEARAAESDPARRARAWREAATIALEELGRPDLAATFAARAERADPSDPASLATLASAFRGANRFRALEKLLWRRLAAEPDPQSESYERAFQELLDLYEGPLRRKEQAKVLRDLRRSVNHGV